MARRPHRRTGGGGTLSPGTHISLTVVQFLAVLALAATAVGGYWWLETNVSAAAAKADSFSAKFEEAIKDIKDAFKDQDNKRGQLDQKVTDVTSKLALEEQREQQIAETLTRIASQVDALRVAAPVSGLGSGGGVAVGGGAVTSKQH